MTPLTQLQLGDMAFSSFGVPEKIPGGGAQMLGVHQLPDGVRVVDVMGANDAPLHWKGMFLGDPPNGVTATDQAQYVDYLRKQGLPVILSWDVYQYTVIVAHVEWEFERYFQIPYSIECTVVEDQTTPVTEAPPSSADDLVTADWANTLGSAQALNMAVPSDQISPFSVTPAPPTLSWSDPVSGSPTVYSSQQEAYAALAGPNGYVPGSQAYYYDSSGGLHQITINSATTQ